jgi:hypothetical protein
MIHKGFNIILRLFYYIFTNFVLSDNAIILFVRSSIIIIQFFIISVPSQQLQGQLQTHHSVDTSNYIMDKYYIKSKTNYRQAMEEKTH